MYEKVDLLINAKATLGESPVWDAANQLLYWVDIFNNKLHRTNPATGQDASFDVGQHVGAVAVRASGGVVLALKDGFAAYDLANESLRWLQRVENSPDHYFNDGKCDPAGRFIAGTSTYAENDPIANLYALDSNLKVRQLLDGITISNGIAWSLDHKTMYYIDSPTYTVTAFDYDLASGEIANQRTIIRVPKPMGVPDGMTIDNAGRLWIAHWGGGQVCCWHPESGDLLQTIYIPASQTTSCTFGGANLDTLFVTSARLDLPPAQLQKEPYAGSLFAVQTNCQGIAGFAFAG